MNELSLPEPVLTLKDVAAYLKVDDRTIYRLAQAKKMPAFKVGGTWRFRKGDIDAWIEAQLHQKGGATP
jgi:excisionase family DNA binding protein